MTTIASENDRFTLTVADIPAGEIDVISFTGREGVNRLYRFDVRLLSNSPRVAPEQLLGKRARLAIGGVQTPRYVHGVVSRIAPLTTIRGETSYSLRIVPRADLLSRRKTSRIFQDKTTPEIVDAVVGELGATVEHRLERTYAKREYCVQYQETDLEFVTRLLAEEGVFYFFTHASPASPDAAADEAREVLVLADSSAAYSDIDGTTQLPFREAGSLVSDEAIYQFRLERRVREGSTLVRGFDYEKPQFVPVAQARVPASDGFDETPLRAYDHDRVLEPKTVGGHVAELRLEELRSRAKLGAAESSSPRLVPGARFELVEHPHDGTSGKYVVAEIQHQGHEPRHGAPRDGNELSYSNRLRCVPESVALRRKRPARRVLQVTETAVVVGPPGEEIHTDELGRIKIQFHWDLEGKNDEHSSCWVRVMQAWSGASWGTQFIPRVGMEAVVSFTGGDPDRPIVLGCVYNGATPTPFALPGEKTKSGIRTRSSPGGKGYNQLSFQDSAGAEEIYLHAERDLNEVVEHDHTRTVYGQEVVQVKESKLLEVQQDDIRVIRGSEILVVEKNFVLNVAGHKLIQVGTPPTPPEKDRLVRDLPDDASPYAQFHALASLPMFEDPATAKASKISRSKILWQSEQLDKDAYPAGQALVSRVAELDKKVEALAGAVHLLTDDILSLRERTREAEQGTDPVGDTLSRTSELLGRATDVSEKLSAVLGDCGETVPPIAKLQKAIAEHVTPKLERSKAIVERLETYKKLLSNADELFSGWGDGGGGATSGKFVNADVSFSDYHTNDGKKGTMPSDVKGSKLDITGPGEIVATTGFKITCGASVIEMTPGSISIKSSGPIKVNGSEILLNE
ncbi:MAG: type VI secretion system tip protein TssI/VgrG [Polyangiaceae bacterium]